MNLQGQGVYEEFLYLFLNFAVNLKTTIKKPVVKKLKTTNKSK